MGITRKRSEEELLAAYNVSIQKMPPHDPTQEQLPHTISLAKDWKTLNFWIGNIRYLLAQPFKNNENPTVVMEILARSIEEIVPEPKRIPVGVIGKMGHGKSAVLNSLFGVNRIALSSGCGKGTWTHNEFCGRKEGQDTEYLAEVFFISPAERHELMAGFFRDCDGNPSSRTEVVDALLQLFKDLPECESADSIHRMFAGANDHANARAMVVQLTQWSANLIALVAENEETETIRAPTTNELQSQLEKYASKPPTNSNRPHSSLWQLVSTIRIHSGNALTEIGMSFLDSPELSDLEKQHKLCDLPRSRGITHAIIASAFIGLGESHVAMAFNKTKPLGSGRAVVVVSGTDDIRDYMPDGSKSQRDAAGRLQKRHDDIEQELDAVDELLLVAANDEQRRQLNAQKNDLGRLLWHASKVERAHRIGMRNEAVKDEVGRKLAGHTGSEVPIFPISNIEYAKHLKGFYPLSCDAPVFSVEETNVPDLRRQIATFPNEIRLDEMRQVVEVAIPSLLDRLEAFASEVGTHDKLRSDLTEILPQTRAIMDGPVRRAFRTLRRDFR